MERMEKWIRAKDMARAIQDYGCHAIEDGAQTLDPVDDIVALACLVDHLPALLMPEGTEIQNGEPCQ